MGTDLMSDCGTELIGEQLRHAVDLLQAEINQLKQQQVHEREFTQHRLTTLETQARDFETRIRSATDGVTQFKVWSGLATGGSYLVSALALLRSIVGL